MRTAVRGALFVALAVWMVAGACRPSVDDRRDVVTVFAAASTTDVLARIAAHYEQRTGVSVRTSFASSSTLAKQIEAGAAADLYVSANPGWMDYLTERGLVRADTRVDIASNTLVLVVPRGRAPAVRFEAGFPIGRALGPRLALGDPDHVPAGVYARSALEALGWWDALADRVVPALDVRVALRFVELGEADAGIVYGSDAAASDRVEVVGAFPDAVVPPVRYPAALTARAGPAAAGFLAFLRGPEAAEELRRAGFVPLTGAP